MRLTGRQIDCVRGGRAVFSRLDFEGSSGHALAVIGPNGSGKTSVLRLIAGLLVPAGGSVALEGGADELTLPEQAHYLGHRDALKPALSQADWRSIDRCRKTALDIARRRRRRTAIKRPAARAVSLQVDGLISQGVKALL